MPAPIQISITSSFDVKFFYAMNTSSVNSRIAVYDSAGNNIGATVSWSGGDTLVLLSPTASLDYCKPYSVYLQTGSITSAGKPILSVKSWDYFTEEDPNPSSGSGPGGDGLLYLVSSSSVAAGQKNISRSGSIVIYFNYSMYTTNTENAITFLPLNKQLNPPTYSCSWTNSNKNLYINITGTLERKEDYYITIGTGARETLSGTYLTNPYSIPFVTNTDEYEYIKLDGLTTYAYAENALQNTTYLDSGSNTNGQYSVLLKTAQCGNPIPAGNFFRVFSSGSSVTGSTFNRLFNLPNSSSYFDYTLVGQESSSFMTGNSLHLNIYLNQSGIIYKTIWATVVDDDGNIYIGGNFLTASGYPRQRLAKYDKYFNLLDWNPSADYDVYDMVLSGNTLFVAGYFDNISGSVRHSLAALDKDTGNVTNFNPNVTGRINSIALSGTTLFLGGAISNVSGTARNGIASVDTTTGALTFFNPNITKDGFGNFVTINHIMVYNNYIYAVGLFDRVSGSQRNNIAMINSTTGALSSSFTGHTYNAGAEEVYKIVYNDGYLFIGGSFITVNSASCLNVAKLQVNNGQLVSGWRHGWISGNYCEDINIFNNNLYATFNYNVYMTSSNEKIEKNFGKILKLNPDISPTCENTQIFCSAPANKNETFSTISLMSSSNFNKLIAYGEFRSFTGSTSRGSFDLLDFNTGESLIPIYSSSNTVFCLNQYFDSGTKSMGDLFVCQNGQLILSQTITTSYLSNQTASHISFGAELDNNFNKIMSGWSIVNSCSSNYMASYDFIAAAIISGTKPTISQLQQWSTSSDAKTIFGNELIHYWVASDMSGSVVPDKISSNAKNLNFIGVDYRDLIKL